MDIVSVDIWAWKRVCERMVTSRPGPQPHSLSSTPVGHAMWNSVVEGLAVLMVATGSMPS